MQYKRCIILLLVCVLLMSFVFAGCSSPKKDLNQVPPTENPQPLKKESAINPSKSAGTKENQPGGVQYNQYNRVVPPGHRQ